ncbi:uncharacterized protein [Montipora capricornis]|uniref:uncharacterized protein isoform X2 n=1 Tax=Montipora capricornis TaxID=246305 RepID=UPI0035F13FCD
MIHRLSYEEWLNKQACVYASHLKKIDIEEETEHDDAIAAQKADTEPNQSAVDFCSGSRRQVLGFYCKDEKRQEGKEEFGECKQTSGEDVDNSTESYEEEKPDLTNADITLFWKRKNIAEKAVCGLNRASEDTTKVIDDNSSPVEYMKITDKELLTRIAKHIIMQVYGRIGCFENFMRYADWADEPGITQRNVTGSSVTNDLEESLEKITGLRLATIAGDNEETSDRQPPTLPACRDTLIDDNDKQGGCRQLYFSQVSFDNEGISETSLLSTPKTPEPIAESIEEPSPTVTTPHSRKKIKKRILKKHSPGKWPSGLKRKRENLLHGEFEESQSSDEESCSDFSEDEERIAAFKEFILLGGAKTKEGEDILVLNPSKIPSKREFTGKKEYSQVMDSLFLYHDRLARCVLYKPSLKLKALVVLSWPFLANDMKEKIWIVKSRRDFASAQRLADDM